MDKPKVLHKLLDLGNTMLAHSMSGECNKSFCFLHAGRGIFVQGCWGQALWALHRARGRLKCRAPSREAEQEAE